MAAFLGINAKPSPFLLAFYGAHLQHRLRNAAHFHPDVTFSPQKKANLGEDIPDSCWVHDCLFRSDRKTDYSVLNSKLIFVPSLTLSSALAPMRMAGFYVAPMRMVGFYVRQKFSESTISAKALFQRKHYFSESTISAKALFQRKHYFSESTISAKALFRRKHYLSESTISDECGFSRNGQDESVAHWHANPHR